MVVLITGATGFIGGHLVPRLLGKGLEVHCLVRSLEKAECLPFKDDVRFIVGDITDPASLRNLDKDFDYVIHLAAMGHVSASSEASYKQFVKINEQGTKNLIDALRGSFTLKRFIHFSSTAAMGPIGLPVLSEADLPNPVTPYQKSKYRSEQMSMGAYEQNGFPTVIIRPCMVYGPGGKGEFLKFCRLMKAGVFPKVGLGQNLTPIVHVKDVVEATVLSLFNGQPGNVYIIASEQSYPMDDIRKYVMKALNIRRPYIYVPLWAALLSVGLLEGVFQLLGKPPVATRQNLRSTTTNRTFDISKAKKELHYEPRMYLEEGICDTVDWFKKSNLL
jgi:nucleoside-diphosphate-sugar epimerase